MIDLNILNDYRLVAEEVSQYYSNFGDAKEGAFQIPSPVDGKALRVVASSGGGWDHVSVSRAKRIPNQREMDHIYRMFFAANETAMQLFVPEAEHINIHPNCLHIWRPQNEGIPKPPRGFV